MIYNYTYCKYMYVISKQSHNQIVLKNKNKNNIVKKDG